MSNSREFPQIYCRFEGRKEINGKRRQYWIQDATEDLFPKIMDHLINNYIGGEIITHCLKFHQDAVSLAEFGDYWRQILQEKLSIVCLTKDNDNNIKLAGFNVLTEEKADQRNVIQFKGEAARRQTKILAYAMKQRDFYAEFNLRKCIRAKGLYVLDAYRGEALGERILDARELLCRAVGHTATITVFSTHISQKQAARAGFVDYVTLEYERLGDVDADMLVPDIWEHSRHIKVMYKLYN